MIRASARSGAQLGIALALCLRSAAAAEAPIDRRSYNLGIIAAFAEMVGAGVKTLALSDVLRPQEADALEAEAARIAHETARWSIANPTCS